MKHDGNDKRPSRKASGEGHHRHHDHPGRRLLDYGDLRLLILSLIGEKPRHGYELIRAVEEQSGGRYTPSPGVLYPTLAWLEDGGFAVIGESEGNRKTYGITPEGRDFLSANRSALQHLLSRIERGGRHGAPLAVAEAMDALKTALRSQLKRPDVEDGAVERVVAILHEAARRIEDGAGEGMEKRNRQEMSTDTGSQNEALPVIERVKHELRRRQLTVVDVQRLSPAMIRIVLGGDELQGFTSLSPADHIKIFVPDGDGGIAMRDYTPRFFDPVKRQLTIDFAVHEAGPATRWALSAKVGDGLQIGGPRGSQIIGGSIAAWLLIGDETALPSIGRRLEEMQAGVPVSVVAAVPDRADEQNFETGARLDMHWLHRADPTDAVPYLEKLKTMEIEPSTFVWIAAEGSVARAIRRYLVEERGHPMPWLKASGYWVQGKADTVEKFDE